MEVFNKGQSILSAILVGKTTTHGCFKMDLVKKSGVYIAAQQCI